MLEHPESKSNFQQQNLLGFIVTAHKLGRSRLEYFNLTAVVLTS